MPITRLPKPEWRIRWHSSRTEAPVYADSVLSFPKTSDGTGQYERTPWQPLDRPSPQRSGLELQTHRTKLGSGAALRPRRDSGSGYPSGAPSELEGWPASLSKLGLLNSHWAVLSSSLALGPQIPPALPFRSAVTPADLCRLSCPCGSGGHLALVEGFLFARLKPSRSFRSRGGPGCRPEASG